MLFLLALTTGCKQKESDLQLFVSFKDLNWKADYAKSGEPVRVNIFSKTNSSALRHLTLVSYDKQFLNQTLLDTVLSDPVKQLDFDYIYHLPYFSDTTTVELRGTAYTMAGDMITYTIPLDVLPGSKPLRPIDGLTMYSAASKRSSAFSFSLMAVADTITLKDDTLWFGDLPQTDETLKDQMTRTWYSHTLFFARFENFDYGEATESMLTDAYRHTTRSHIVYDIHNDDVLLVGTAQEALGVVKVMLVADEEGSANDRYLFSIKTKTN